MNYYYTKKAQIRDEAIEYQLFSSDESPFMSEIVEKTEYFYEQGKKYGLLKEFRENGIL